MTMSDTALRDAASSGGAFSPVPQQASNARGVTCQADCAQRIDLIGAAFGEMSYWVSIIELEDEQGSSAGLE
jgi:hypothetical protein